MDPSMEPEVNPVTKTIPEGEDVMAKAGVPEDSIEDKPVKKTKMKISVKEIEKKLKLAIEKEEYEKAAILRDKIKNMTA